MGFDGLDAAQSDSDFRGALAPKKSKGRVARQYAGGERADEVEQPG
jgi:hypothetical protein